MAKKKSVYFNDEGVPHLPMKFEWIVPLDCFTWLLARRLQDGEDIKGLTSAQVEELLRGHYLALINQRQKADEATLAHFIQPARTAASKLFPQLVKKEQAVPYLSPNDDNSVKFTLTCPVCGDRGQTTGQLSDDGVKITIPLEGDCGHRWTLCVETKKGRTVLYHEVQKNE